MSLPGAAPPKPIPLKERAALIFVERARLDVKDGAFVAIDAHGNRTHIPIGAVACLIWSRARASPTPWYRSPHGRGRWWCGLGRPASGSMPPANRAAHVRTSSCGRRPSSINIKLTFGDTTCANITHRYDKVSLFQ